MILCDVNILVNAFRPDAVDHKRYAGWLLERIESSTPVGVSPLALSGLIRIVTNRRVYKEPTTLTATLEFCEALLGAPNAVKLQPGPRHWSIFARLCRDAGATANLVPDAYHAALAIEHNAEWITTDRDFARFPGLRWRHPLEELR
jgi:toxin-antitoxin system PIN domain toxin